MNGINKNNNSSNSGQSSAGLPTEFFICKSCGRSFLTEIAVRLHIEATHGISDGRA